MLSKLIQAMRAAGSAVAKNVQLVLLAFFPFADQIILVLIEHMPILGSLLPEDLYKWVILVVILASLVRKLVKQRRQAGSNRESAR